MEDTQRGTHRQTTRLLTGPEQESALRLYYCGSESCAPGHFFGPAVRSHYLIHFIRNGRGTYLRGGKTYPLQRGDAFLILPGETTKYSADSREPWDYTWIAFDGSNAGALLSCCSFSPENPVYRAPDEASASRLLEQVQLFESSFQDDRRNVLEILGNFYLLLSCMYPSPAFFPFASVTEGLTGQPQGREAYFQKAVSYLKNNYSYPVRIEQVARQIGVSRSYLYRIFQSCCQKSVQEYLLELRLDQARRLLSDTGRTVTDIAYSCGFPDSPSFCRIFRKACGLTPGAFREKARAQETVRMQ